MVSEFDRPPTPFRLGVDAYNDGMERDACPACFEGRAAMAWLAGWDIGERMARQDREARLSRVICGRVA